MKRKNYIRKGYKHKITEEQRLEILKVYGEQGQKAAAILCREYGVSDGYPAVYASTYGVTTPQWRGKGRKYKNRDTAGRSPKDASDPRWAWAIARGVVIA